MISIIVISIIRFSDLDRWRNVGRWVLVYGRRKTGKSYFIRNNVKWNQYYFVGRSGDIFIDDEKISYETFRREVLQRLEGGEIVVIDEVQRLPREFFDLLHKIGVKGNLIVISSTLWLTKELLESRSPLLGLFSEFQMNLIDERDIILNLQNYVKDTKKLIEYAVFLREPWLIPIWEQAEDIFNVIPFNVKITIPALIGEIFIEEEREYSRIYDAILKAIANGKQISTEIASHLYSLKLIPKDDPSMIQPFLKILQSIGLIEKIKIYDKNKYYYRHSSPIIDYYYYLDAKYGISEREIQTIQARKTLETKLPKYIEQFIMNLTSKTLGLWPEKIVNKNYEIDIALLDYKKLKAIIEVKWKKEITNETIREVEEKMEKYNCRKILIVPNEEEIPQQPKKIEVWDAKKILEIIQSKQKT
ncbi:MAG: ATP-binding protein [Candidatus Methanomethylicia archaeon]